MRRSPRRPKAPRAGLAPAGGESPCRVADKGREPLMIDPSKRSARLRHTLGLRAAGVMVAGLGALTAFGCAAPAADAPAKDAGDEAAPSFVLAMEYDDGSDQYKHKSVEVTDTSLVGEGAQFVNGVGEENTYVYKGYAHGDNAHYSMYSLYTELITDDDGMLTAINLTSGADTWAGKWGYTGARPIIVGTLPDGVAFDYTEQEQGDDTVIKLDLTVEEGTEADNAGYALTEVYLYDVQDDLTTVGSDVTGKGGRTTHNDYDAQITVAEAAGAVDDDDDDDEQAARDDRAGAGERGGDQAAASGRGDVGAGAGERGGDAAAAEVPAAPEGVTVDAETATVTIEDGAYNLVQARYQFGTEVYFDQWIVVGDDANAQAWVDANVQETDLSVPHEISGTAVTNRDKWTYSMLSLIAQRELESWGATFEDESLYTGGNDGEIGDIDTISGATKTSVPFQSALNQAIDAGYVKGVSDEVTVTIDAGDPAKDGIDVSAVHQDQSFVTVDDSGRYVLTMDFPAGIDEAAGSDNLTHAIAPTSVDVYALGDQELGPLGVWNLGNGTAGFTPLASYADSSKAPGDVSDATVTYVSDWDYPYTPVLTVNDPSVTHVVVNYTIGHETLGIAYDLAAMAQAHQVQEAIDALDAGDAQAVAAAREAYDALSNDVKGTVGNYDKLLAAEGK